MTSRIFKKITAVLLCLLITSSAFASNVTVHFSDEEAVTLRKGEDADSMDASGDSVFTVENETETESESDTEATFASGTEAQTEEETDVETEAETEPETEAETETEVFAEDETESDYPAQLFHGTAGSVRVFVNAPDGAFPAGTIMSVASVEDEETIAAIEEAISSQISRIHAVNITFSDAEGKEIEPLIPVSVTLTAEEKKEDEETVVIHVDDDGQAETIPAVDVVSEPETELSVETDADSDSVEMMSKSILSESKLLGRRKTAAPNQSLRAQMDDLGGVQEDEQGIVPEETGSVQFTADQFSVYALVYTVDFEYEVDGKVYQFSLPGGGFVSFTDLVEVLGIIDDTNYEENEDEIGSVIPENAKDDTANEGEKENGVYSDTNTPVTLGVVEVSEATRKFVADVVSVEFSTPTLVDVSRVESETTVGQIKESRGLECQYSVELTEEQIAEINAQTVEVGDWALISLQPFMSEETLTVTMKDGEVFTVHVIDAQIKKTVIDAKGDTWEITVIYGEDAQIPDGVELKVREILPEDEVYYEYYRKAADLVCIDVEEGNLHGYGRLFDISILNGEEVIEPKSNVEVSIKLANAPANRDELRVVHFGESEPDVIKLEETQKRDSSYDQKEEDTRETELRFETDSFSIYAVVSTNTSNGYGLGGQKFAIINRNVNEAVLGRINDRNRIAASSISTQTINGMDYVIADEVTFWEFENVNGNVYNLKAPDGRYINITGRSTATLSDNPQNITITSDGNGLRLARADGYALNAWNSAVADGFGGGNWNNDGERFAIYSVNELIQNKADKISLTDLVNLHDGETPVEGVVIYTRILNQNRDGYDYYAVAADGSLTRVYDIGDTIGWVSSEATPEHLKWKLTVHSNDGEPNGYFDFQSMESGVYLIPTEATGIKADDPDDSWDLGVNMQGWNNGTYGSTVERWDTGSRAYAGYAYDEVNKKIVPTTDDSQKLEFLFAHIKEEVTPNQLHTVETLDGKTKGITIKMYDFDGSYLNPSWPPRSSEMTSVMGNNSTGSTNVNGVGYANRGLVSQTLTNGFPTATLTGRSLNQLFNDAHFRSDASNIFVQQIYNETGYFSYDSSINYAYLDQNQNEFILYRELAAPVMEADNRTPSGQKGNFFPFDSLQELANQNKVFTNGITVKYDGDLQEMSPDNPQYGQKLYKIDHGNTNNYKSYFFGMTMEADFYQGPNGKDERGNDIIYEFNGDDDMWLYIDDRLVLDIGGCHGAVSGTINFSTGEVRVNGSHDQVQTTLKEIFQNAGKLPDGTDWTTAGAEKWFKGNTFADYTKHSFKMFYMERGSYASNLKMRFNLLTIEPGSFVLEKKLPDNVQAAYGDRLFAYQIYTVYDGQENLYTPPAGKNVTYEKSGEMVLPNGQTESAGFKPEYTVNGQIYHNVYFLKAGESIVIPTENNEVHYYVKEIGIDPIYEEVKANGRELVISNEGESRIAQTSTDVVKTRGRVTYENIPKEVYNLRLEKIVQGQLIDLNDSFRFDVRLEEAKTGLLVPYNQGEYYIVKTEADVDHYYKYESGRLVPSNEPVAYKAGISGSIDHIYPGYTILIKGLLPGTDFEVTENLSAGNYPAGYQYVGKLVSNAGQPEVNGADGSILARGGNSETSEEYQDSFVQITNASGTNVRLVKVGKKNLETENPDRLKGASFTISKYTDDSFKSKDTAWGNGGSKVLSDVKNPDGTYTLDGIFVFEQLVAGYYMIEETAFPAGYVRMSGNPTFKVEVDAANGFTVTLINNPDNLLRLEDDMLTIVVGNTPGVALPSTGGPGTRLFTILGSILILGAGILLWRRRRTCLEI